MFHRIQQFTHLSLKDIETISHLTVNITPYLERERERERERESIHPTETVLSISSAACIVMYSACTKVLDVECIFVMESVIG